MWRSSGKISFSPQLHTVFGRTYRVIRVTDNVPKVVGEIRASSRRLQENGRVWICVAVDDNGPGIPADVLPDIFEAFVTTRLDARGTG